MSRLDWHNAGDHVFPCQFAWGGAFNENHHCTCDLPDRMIIQHVDSDLSWKEVLPAYAERNRRKREYAVIIALALDE